MIYVLAALTLAFMLSLFISLALHAIGGHHADNPEMIGAAAKSLEFPPTTMVTP